ncbi:MAG: barstar family protein [Eubacteriales bacterium]|jgi:ribonuclease inhibitor
MKKVILDLRNVHSREAVQELIMQKLQFPDYYGKNLDALHDCLTDLDEDIVLVVQEPADTAAFPMEGIQPGDEADDGYLRRLNRVLMDAGKTSRHLCPVIFRGELVSDGCGQQPGGGNE